jgi:5,10-methylenetetrahydromethanopterin reductase
VLPRLAVRLDGAFPPRDCLRLARAAEAYPFGALWFAENPFARSAVPAAAACAAATKRLRIGVGVVNPFSRHPSLIAMEWAALAELAQGRTVLGIGAGIAEAVRRMGFEWDRPLSAVRDALHIVRGLLRGEEVTYRGRVFSIDRVRLDFSPPRPEPPIFMAAVGDRSLKLCGEIADGMIVSNLLPSGYTTRAAAIVRDAACGAGRSAPEIVQYVPCVARPDRSEARKFVKLRLAPMLVAFWSLATDSPARRTAMVGQSGIAAPEFAAAVSRLRGGEAADRVLDDRFVDAFAIAGTAADCLERAVAYRAAGVEELALNFVGPDPAGDLAYLGRALAAAVRTGV